MPKLLRSGLKWVGKLYDMLDKMDTQMANKMSKGKKVSVLYMFRKVSPWRGSFAVFLLQAEALKNVSSPEQETDDIRF